MPSNYERGEIAGLHKGVEAVRVLLDKLAAAKNDAAEWREQHENLLAMFRAAEQRAIKAEASVSETEDSELAKAVLAYDAAINGCANDPEKMASFCTAQGDDLDTLYFKMVNAARSKPPKAQPITDNDARWRFLEHGCQWVSWIPINGAQVSFDPRNVTGYAGDLTDMRAQADIERKRQLAILEEGIRRSPQTAVPK